MHFTRLCLSDSERHNGILETVWVSETDRPEVSPSPGSFNFFMNLWMLQSLGRLMGKIVYLLPAMAPRREREYIQIVAQGVHTACAQFMSTTSVIFS